MIRPTSAVRADRRSIANGIQLLNPIDRAMRCADLAVRQLGYPGIETQMLVCLRGRAETEALRRAIERLGRRYPVITSRLIDSGLEEGGRPYWKLGSGQPCALREQSLPSDDPAAVLEHASLALSQGSDPAAGNPLEFHLLHRPGGKDVLLLQYSHVLMDNTLAVPLLRELTRLTVMDPGPVAQNGRRDPIFEHLRQFRPAHRREAIEQAVQLQAHALRGKAATLVPPGPRPPGPARLAITSRTLSREETAALRSEIVGWCGFPCLSMAVLASAFRAIDQLGPSGADEFVAGIGIPLPRDAGAALDFQNLTSVVPIHLPRHELRDRERAVRLLCGQLRQRLDKSIDLGVLGTAAIFDRRFRYVEWVVWHLLRYGYSLWYAFFGELDRTDDWVCGQKVENIYYAGGPLWPAIGLALLANQYRGALHLQVTFDTRLVGPALAEQFLDVVLAELTSRQSQVIASRVASP